MKRPRVEQIELSEEQEINLRWVDHEDQYKNRETQKKMQLAHERLQKSWKLKPLIKKMLEIEPDKLELVKTIINYKS